MKTLAILAAFMLLAACAADPSAFPASGQAQAAATTNRPAPDQPSDKVVSTAKPRQVCKNDEATGSRMKRPRCYDAPDDNEKVYRDDRLRENTDELRALDERNTLRSSTDSFGR